MTSIDSLHKLAHQLLTTLPLPALASPDGPDEAALACDRLRQPLIRLAGVTGFCSLLSRALSLAKRRTTALAGYTVQPDGTLGCTLETHAPPQSTDARHEAAKILLTELLNLLVTFIGETLMLQLLREAWPDAALERHALNTEDQP